MAAAIVVDPCIKRRNRWGWLVGDGAKTHVTIAVGGQAPEGMMLLGAIESIAETVKKVKFL